LKLEVNAVEVQSNMQYDESVEMGIGHDAIPMVIERLISAYNFPEQAVLREYTSNAYDVHVEQGVTRPVEVELPSPLAANLRIRDYGVGLSREELKGFGQFGQSTKRDTNELTGGFGLGSKSGLAVASQFIVTSIKDGKRNTVVVARDEQNRPHMNFLAEAETDDDSGTLITIPIASRDRLGNLDNFFLGWKPGTITIDGEQPKYSLHDENYYRPLKNGSGWKDLTGTTSPRDMVRVVINQVSYLLHYNKIGISFNEWSNLKGYIIKVDNGSVKIAPSREDLIYNTPTKEALQKRMQEALQVARVDFEEAINNAPNIKTALRERDRMARSGYPADDIKYKGKYILLPGTKFRGNKLPNPIGTWCSPQWVGHTKTGWLVEKVHRELSHVTPWDWSSDYRRLVIVHSAKPAERYYTQAGSRIAHSEYAYVGDWLNSLSDPREHRYEIFITNEPLNRLNRIYRDIADVVISAEDFMAAASVQRAARIAQENSNKARDTRLQVIRSSYHGVADISRMTPEEIKKEYDAVIILRNQAGGMEQWVRESMTTKTNYSSKYSGIGTFVATEAKAALILVNKNTDLTDVLPLLPPETTIGKVAAKAVLDTIKTPTKWELMALRDRNLYSTYGIRSLMDSDISKIKHKPTQKWLKALRDYRDTGQSTRDRLEWLIPYLPEVKEAFDKIKDPNKNKIGESLFTRYPLLNGIDGSRAEPAAIVDYINLKNAALKG
jgi:hypothetical protein